jgi:hypothetical protein
VIDMGSRWLVTLPGGLGDILSFWPLMQMVLNYGRKRDIIIDIASIDILLPVLKDVVGLGNVYAWSETPLHNFDWCIDLAVSEESRLFMDKCRYDHLITRPDGQNEYFTVDGFRHDIDVFKIGRAGREGNPDLPCWMVEAPLIAQALGVNHWQLLEEVSTNNQVHFKTPHHQFVTFPRERRRAYLVPCGSIDAKRWPLENWLSLGMALEKLDMELHVVLGPLENNYGDDFDLLCQGRVIRALDLRKLAAHFAQAALVVANDCGPMHLAGFVGASLIGIFGPTNPKCWFPYKAPNQIVLQVEAPIRDPWGILPDQEVSWDYWPHVNCIIENARIIIAIQSSFSGTVRTGYDDQFRP